MAGDAAIARAVASNASGSTPPRPRPVSTSSSMPRRRRPARPTPSATARSMSASTSTGSPAATPIRRPGRLGGVDDRDRVEHPDRGTDPASPQGEGLVEGRHAEAVGAGGLERAGDGHGAVAVGVGLDDGMDRHAGPPSARRLPRLATQRVEIELQPGDARQRRQAGPRPAGPRSGREPGSSRATRARHAGARPRRRTVRTARR